MPLNQIFTQNSSRQPAELAGDFMWNIYDLTPPYQRGSVWTEDDQRALWKSLLQRLPIGSIFINRRGRSDHTHYVVDGKQRLIALRDFYTGKLTLPREWFADEDVAIAYRDQAFVNIDQLSDAARNELTGMSLATISVYESTLETVQEEADLFLRINRGGVDQQTQTLIRAEQIAGS